MSKPIKLTEELLQKIQEEFIAQVKSSKMFDGKLKYERTFKWEGDNDRAVVYLSSVAFAKMNGLIQQFSDEVAWHGVVHRDENDPTMFHVTDILVYPQVVTGATVNTDQEAYQTWLYSFDDEVFNNIRMQGHSHVNMGVTPSGVDTTHQEKILEQIADDDYYIFMIWNKHYEHFVRIFDLKYNTLYDSTDVDVYIGDDGVDLPKFLASAKELVTRRTYTAGYQTGYQTQGKVTTITPAATTTTPAATTPAKDTTKTKPKVKPGGTSAGIGSSYQDYGYSAYDGWSGAYD